MDNYKGIKKNDSKQTSYLIHKLIIKEKILSIHTKKAFHLFDPLKHFRDKTAVKIPVIKNVLYSFLFFILFCERCCRGEETNLYLRTLSLGFCMSTS